MFGSATSALRLSGRDALDLLHRLSTQALADLAVGEGRATMFCDFRGRLQHRAWVVRDERGLWLLRDDAPAAELAAFLDRSIFRDDVQLVDATGAAEAPVLPPTERFANETERIRAGHPRHGHEIVDEFTPFEINRAQEVHLSKGCYTGQEALLRLITYKSVRRRLVLVSGSGAAPAVPLDVVHGDARRGRLTSATAPPDGGWIGLAVLANAAAEEPDDLRVDGRPLASAEPFELNLPLGIELGAV